MKKLIYNNSKMPWVVFALAFVALWAVWYFGYHYFIIWLEGFSFFSTLPDFTTIMLKLPEDFARYVGAFLLQFYSWPVLGALIMALLSMAVVVCLYVIVRRLFEKPESLYWVALLPLPVLGWFQSVDLTLSVVITCFMAAFVLMLIVLLATVRKKSFIHVPGFLRNRWFALAISLVSVVTAMFLLLNDNSLGRKIEGLARLEYYAENQQWDNILKTVSTEEAKKDEHKRKYVLLALSEKGILPDYAFRYGLSSQDDFTFLKVEEPLCLNFNVLFYKSLGMYNYQIYQLYQQSVQSLPGMSFDSVRELADAYLKLKDYDLAKKYIDILSHSTCHKSWVAERLPVLESIKDADTEYVVNGSPFFLMSFLPDISSMYDRHADDPKFAHFMLCAILSEKNGEIFYNVFKIVAKHLYANGEHIPRLYQEALLLFASKEPEILDKYPIEKQVWDRFVDFTNLMQQGKTAQANRKYADTYWAYVY